MGGRRCAEPAPGALADQRADFAVTEHPRHQIASAQTLSAKIVPRHYPGTEE